MSEAFEAYKIMFTDYPDVVKFPDMLKMLGIGEKQGYILLKEKKIRSFGGGEGKAYNIPKIYIIDYVLSLVN